MSTLPVKFNQLLVPVGSIDAYLSAINQIPMLTVEEEQDLTTRLYENNDVEAARRLVMSHLRFVARIAKSYLGYGLALADIIQEGNIGLMKAVKRFDPRVGVRLVTFAVHWIKAEIHEFIIKNWRIVKIATTKAQRKLFFNLRSQKKRLGWFSKEEVESVAEDLGVKPSEVLEMESRLNAVDAAFDPMDDSDDDHQFAPAQYLENLDADPALLAEQSITEKNVQNQLRTAVGQLDERSKDIIESRWLVDSKATLHDLAARYQISAERVRQLEKNAMIKLKTAMAI